MSSNINPNNINGNYPVAGQDNDSQGFRDNFTNAKNNFQFAKNEIDALQAAIGTLQTGLAIDSATNSILAANLLVSGTWANVGNLSVASTAIIGGNVTITGTNANVVVLNTTGNVNVGGNTSVTNDHTVGGRVIHKGAKIEQGYQYYSPSTNFSYALWSNISRFVLDPSGTISNGALTLPTGILDGHTVHVSSTAQITALQVNPGAGQTLSPGANVLLSGGTGITFFYHSSETKWYKVA